MVDQVIRVAAGGWIWPAARWRGRAARLAVVGDVSGTIRTVLAPAW